MLRQKLLNRQDLFGCLKPLSRRILIQEFNKRQRLFAGLPQITVLEKDRFQCSRCRMSDRLKSFTIDVLHAVVFRLGVAETVEPLDEVARRLREELIEEIKARDE